MLNFDNRGHREELQRLGILPQGQDNISPQELARNTIDKQKVEDVLYLLRQEVATYGTKFQFIEESLKRAKRQAETISDKASLEKAESTITIILVTLQQSTEQTELIDQVTTAIDTALATQPTFAASITPSIREHLQVIRQFTTTLPDEAHQKSGLIIEQLTVIEALIEEKRQGLV